MPLMPQKQTLIPPIQKSGLLFIQQIISELSFQRQHFGNLQGGCAMASADCPADSSADHALSEPGRPFGVWNFGRRSHKQCDENGPHWQVSN